MEHQKSYLLNEAGDSRFETNGKLSMINQTQIMM